MLQFTIQKTGGKLILFATILASGMAFLDGSVVNIAIPTIQAKFQASLLDVQWIVNAYTLLLSALILISGSLGDRFGRKKIFTYGIGLFIFASFLCSISQSIHELIAFRALQGIGGAMMVPGSLSIINTAFAEQNRGRAIGLWSGFSGGISALGPLVGGYLVQTFGWQSIFYINIPLGLLALFITIKFVPESKNSNAKSIDIIGTILILIGLLGIAYSLINIPVTGLSQSINLISLIVGVAALIAFLYAETKVKQPLVPFSIFKSQLVTGSNLATLFLYFALSGVIFFFVLYLQQAQHVSPLDAGLAMLPSILLITFLSGRGGTIADKYGPRIPMIVGPIIVAIGMASLAISGLHANYFIAFMPGLILIGLGMATVIAPLTKSALSVPHEHSGAASGVNNAVARIAGLLAVALLGGVILSIFTTNLHTKLQSSNLSQTSQQQIMQQSDKLGAITIPHAISIDQKQQARIIIDKSFLSGFRIVMLINAALAFASAVVSFFLIYSPKKT